MNTAKTLPDLIKWECYAYVTGKKKRARTIKQHQIEVGQFDIACGLDEIKDKARQRVKETMKTLHSNHVTVSMNYVIIKDNGGWTSTTWEPFSDKNKKIGLEVEL